MSGFRNVRAYADSIDTGKGWISSFRKVPAVTTIAGQWFDFSGAAGNPVPNYFASEPLAAATLDPYKGILHGPDVAPEKKYIHRITTAIGGAAAAGNVEQVFCDYLLYYPFIDMDAAGEEQLMTNDVALPRWASGAGVKMMLLAQATTIGGGQFTVNYTNSDGVAGRVTPIQFCAAAQPTGALVQAETAAAGLGCFVSLQSGDSGIRSVQSVTFSVANGGLAALVLVKPLQRHYQREPSATAAEGSPAEVESLRERAGLSPEIQDGAFLSFIGRTAAGSASGAAFTGILETVWG
jgi:hypothetical protein